jgi:transposase
VGMIIGMDSHKRSATIKVIDILAAVVAAGRFGTDKAGYAQMLAAGREFSDRIWAIEGCNGIGKHLAHRLVHDGEIVVDVPPKLPAQVRVFATGNGRKTDPVDAHSVAMAALRSPGLAQVSIDDDLVVMGMLADRRDELGRARTQTVNRLHRLLLELFPGGAKQFLSAQLARAMLATIRPRDLPGKTRRRLAAELIGELEAIDKKIKAIRKELTVLVTARGSTLLELHGIGPSSAARLLAGVGDIHRFADRDKFASWNGTAPLDASSGNQETPPSVAGREPPDQPGAAHHGRRPAAQPDPGPALLPCAQGRRDALDDGHARPQAALVQRRLRPHARRPETTGSSGPGRATGDDY